ncbi:uncharacterized protein LOC110060023 isoform X1 [Orbicella faveolata]|uniref:uncharacterized protein LOC110060023 isoform X1 n=1 Tax=Orbicella faveolata TaxID=48498 RepID=UPI0009E64B64|nr:uncharacterized protein LOC110060023 isoform X1 [Orbicella faveolata]XP_020622421.1 uncharacterized protein LOC110060023 isoform X1 [Orbicella faveolata]
MSDNIPQRSQRVPHYCIYGGCDCSDKYLTKRFCREFANGNELQSLIYLSKESNWNVSRLQEEMDLFNLQETKDEATFCCKTSRFVAKVVISSFGEKVFETELPINVQKCSAMIGPPPHLPFTLSGWATKNTKACLMIIDENKKIILQLPLHSKDFLLESTKRPEENGEMEQAEHAYTSGEHEAPQQTEKSQRV